ncbi:hypothetical protein S40288_07905 [Stachybotrys chartarum IBT 40288]|nr:hypothetical protein S40288_07905 [Stachybotrys chartarum IBT 40288]
MASGILPHQTHPRLALAAAFAAWKSLLLAIALGTALAADYDTSTSVFFDVVYGAGARVPALAHRLTRWDALYFVHAAHRGYVYEQEWAFGTGLPMVVRAVLGAARVLGVPLDGVSEPVTAIAIAHISHLGAVLALYELTILLFQNRRLAFVASVLHVISPAGLFLSAPYAESPFACLSFLGLLLFALSIQNGADGMTRHVTQVAAGAIFGLTTLLRSNGVLNGLLFAVEAVHCLLAFVKRPGFHQVLHLVAPILGGLLVAAGFVAPQAVAWTIYCGTDIRTVETRAWCTRLVPSIYGFVQEHYWNVGFLRYWTPGNIPLFLLALPVITLLLRSGIEVSRDPFKALNSMLPVPSEPHRLFVRTLAATQLILGIMAVTSYHVQIITRIASGYPVWYWWVANNLAKKEPSGWAWTTTVFMALYGNIQGGLFASFLPPA